MILKLCLLAILLDVWQIRPVISVTRFDPAERLRRMNQYYSNDINKRSTMGSPSRVLGLKNGEKLQKVASFRTADGTMKTKYQETYKGINILGETIVMGQDQSGQYTNEISGSLVEGIQNDVPSVKPRISASDAFKIAVNNQRDNMRSAIFDPKTDAKLEIMVTGGSDDKQFLQTTKISGSERASLVYVLSYNIVQKKKVRRRFYIIDAITARVVVNWEALTSKSSSYLSEAKYASVGGNKKVGMRRYDGKQFSKLKITQLGNTCIFENYAVRVIDMQSTWETYFRRYNKTFTFDCQKRFIDAVNGAYSPLSDVLFHATVVHDMYKSWYGTAPLKSKIQARVHFGYKYPNAFWDGRYITFGDGCRKHFYPFVSLDVVGHEIAHGIVEQNSDLWYWGQSGGMNEAFADMTGEAAEYFLLGKNDWLVGHEIRKNKTALRYFKEPSRDGRSIKHAAKVLTCGDMNVHYSSGVFNHVFYTLANKPGWNVRQAYDIMMLANKLYWRPRSDFGEGACGAVSAAIDLGYNHQDVREVFLNSGVVACQSELLIFSNLNGNKNKPLTFSWNIPDTGGAFQLRTTQGRGNVDVYIKKGSIPTALSYDASSKNYGNEEMIEVKKVTPGIYYISLLSRTGFSGVGMSVRRNFTGTGYPLLESFDSLGTCDIQQWPRLSLQVPQNVSGVIFNGKVDSGFVLMFLRYGKRVQAGCGRWRLDKFAWFTKNFNTAYLCNNKPGVYHAMLGSWYPFMGTKITYSYLTFPQLIRSSTKKNGRG